jgi:hypothetical protein
MNQFDLEMLKAGLPPSGYQTSAQQADAGTKIPAAQRAKQFANKTLEDVMSSMNNIGGGLAKVPTGRLGLGLGIVPGVTTAFSQINAGNPMGAAGALGGAGVGGLLGAGAARFVPSTGRYGLIGKAAQAVLPALGAYAGAKLGADAAEYGREQLTGIPTKNKEGEFASQLAAARTLADLGTTQYRNNLNVQTSNLKDLTKFNYEQQYLNTQRMLPIVNQMKNADLIRQQSLIASQGQQLGNLSVLNTAGQLATGGQAETGATIRTMLTANPYANAVLR